MVGNNMSILHDSSSNYDKLENTFVLEMYFFKKYFGCVALFSERQNLRFHIYSCC